MRVVLPCAALRCFYSIEYIIPACLVCMPKHITCMCKGVCKRINRCTKTIVFKYIYKGEVHVQVIIQTGVVQHVVTHQAIVPHQWLIVTNECALVPELIRTAKRDADGLSCPAAFYFI